MIELVIAEINNRIKSDLGYYKSMFNLCEIIKKDESEFPAYYSKNEYKKVIDFDKQFSTIYYRVDGDIQVSTIEEELPIFLQNKIYSIKLVSCIRKNTFGLCKNNEAIDEYVADNLSNIIYGSYSQFANTNKLESCFVEVSNISLNRDSILSNELKIKDMKFSYDWSIVTLNLEISISQYKKCFTKLTC